MEQIEVAESCLEKVAGSDDVSKKPAVKKNLAKAQEALKDGKGVLVTRQKHIKLADRSENGWNTVNEYQDDELASDSEDEKRIEKAERAAERKAAKSRKRKSEAASRATKFKKTVQFTTPNEGVGGPSRRTGGSSQIGPCHNCQEMAQRDCRKPSVSAAVTPKWYPFKCSSDRLTVGKRVV